MIRTDVGGALRLLNCSGGSIKAKTYNSNDGVMWVAFEEKSIGNGSLQGLKCATGSCKVAIGSGKPGGAISGYQVLIGGKIRATNSAATAKGCSVYK